MVRAAFDGRIDFSKARLRDPMWYLRLQMTLLEQARREDLALTELWHRRCADKVLLYVANQDQFPTWVKNELEAFSELWSARTGQKKAVNETPEIASEAKNRWAAAFGDPSDPKVQSDIDAVAAAMVASQKSKSRPRR